MDKFKPRLQAVSVFSLHMVLVEPKFRSKCGSRYVKFAVCHISDKVFTAGNNNNKIIAKVTNSTGTNTK